MRFGQKKRPLILLGATILGFSVSVTLQAQTVDLSTLSAQSEKKFKALAQEEFCSCDSSLTIAGCLDLRPKCELAKHFSSVIIHGLEAGLDGDTILAFLSERTIGPFCGKTHTIDVSGALEKEIKTPVITLIEFADFRCSHCRKARHTVHQALKKYGQRVHFIFVPFPLQDHPESVLAAEAAMAANAQGKAWPMHDALFEHQGTFDMKSLEVIARKVGLNMKTFRADMKAHRFKGKVSRLKEAGFNAGVESTPAFFVNGRPFTPDEELLTFTDRFEMELARNQASCK